ncbi:DTW domain-containing protein [Spongiibacter nanhainus]|uniref:tRNA-uridine aminocarboxypropyltransferase n=2 Tax=Spongiibacter nanhainus TaxID=2794344 RepID=A0A7T4URL5_9GAMM|nr:tRNA-uridine aminocarboxypropyltransferase [Spongiibacter nanhainus]QQD19938.1 DTW domain-containing protein [Spongiibacter nanhainus]
MPSRPTCSHCQRPLSVCLCETIVQRDSVYRVLILQHPKEARHALSSAPLLRRSIGNSCLLVGEVFDPPEIVGANWRDTSVLLYPGESAMTASAVESKGISQLIVLDGTWRKTAKILHLNPWLGELPRLALQPNSPSRYRIRKAPRPDSLSTIEATAEALNLLHGNTEFTAILGAFERMIDQQIEAMGETTFKRNYADRQ